MSTPSEAPTEFVFEVRASIDLAGRTPAEIKDHIQRSFENAIGNGALTGGSPATVESFESSVTVVDPIAQKVTEEQIQNYLLEQIQDGNLDLEDLTKQAGKYALIHPAAIQLEFAERLHLYEEDASPSENGPRG